MVLKELKTDEFFFKYILITGLSNIRMSFDEIQEKLSTICNENQVIIQIFNAELVADWEHLFFSAIHSLEAFKQGKNLSNKLDIELLLYASGQHQIKVAIDKFGIRLETENIALLIMSNSIELLENAKLSIFKLIKGTEDESILKINENKFRKLCEIFKISSLEIETASDSADWEDKIEALKQIVLNRIAFLIFEI